MKYNISNVNEIMEKAMNLPSVQELYKSFWFENELNILFAEANVGKSILAVQIAEHIARTGRKVLYLDFELSLNQLRSRYSDKNGAYMFSKNLYRPEVELMEEEEFFELLNQAIYKEEINTIIVDNITYLCSKLEIGNQATKLMQRLKYYKEKFKLSIMVVAHTKKRNNKNTITLDDLAGSKRLANFADSIFVIGRANINTEQLYLKQLKVRQSERIYNEDNVLLVHIEKNKNFLQFVENGYANEEELLDTKRFHIGDKIILKAKCLQLKMERLSNREIAKRLYVSEGTIRNWLKNCEQEALEAHNPTTDVLFEELA
jgi:KaiC/GvpD/RAD55 family RecA-like ATPase